LAAGARRTKVDAAQTFHDTVALLCETAQTLGVDLLIENNVLSRRNLVEGRNELLLCVTADDFHELFDAVDSRSLGILLDVAHLKVSAQTLGMDRRQTIDQLRSYVRAVHLSDNDGATDDNQPFERDAWFVQHLPMFPNAICVIETRPLDAPALAACMRIVEDAS
jgi:sugar phosphate isomerase/epimerase